MEKAALFPKLNVQQISALEPYGVRRRIHAGECIVKIGETNHHFFVALEGSIGIYDRSMKLIMIHGPGEFTGNSDSISERAAVFSAYARVDSTVLEIPQAKLKEFIAKNQDLGEALLRAFLSRRANELDKNIGSIRLIGSARSPDTFRLREFFSKNQVQYDWINPDNDPASEKILSDFGISIEERPMVIENEDRLFENPSIEEIGAILGLSTIKDDEFDLLIVGAGPAGLAASVYAASEGLNVATIDSLGPGGQAGSSSRIENYPGFPMGISGSELANNCYIQAQKFGCNVSVPHKAKSISHIDGLFHLETESGKVLKGRAVVAATGAMYRSLPVENLSNFEGCGIYYSATHMEAAAVSGSEVIIVGGGNSAGQAALFLSKKASCVHLAIRGADLSRSMSSYLINRIEDDPMIRLHINTEVKELKGGETLEEAKLANKVTGEESIFRIPALFLFLGAIPCTEWLRSSICVDGKGFALTGRDIPEAMLKEHGWPYSQPPQSLETCMPGLFAVGDIRSGSVKRVASAVGEGAIVVSQVHACLNKIADY